jgi:hypothetical protein
MAAWNRLHRPGAFSMTSSGRQVGEPAIGCRAREWTA